MEGDVSLLWEPKSVIAEEEMIRSTTQQYSTTKILDEATVTFSNPSVSVNPHGPEVIGKVGALLRNVPEPNFAVNVGI